MSDNPPDMSDKMSDTLPDASFGAADAPLPDWRKDDTDDTPDDDEPLVETPEDVIAMLGFDPLEEAEPEDGAPTE